MFGKKKYFLKILNIVESRKKMKQYKLLEIQIQYDLYLKKFYNTYKQAHQLSYNELYSLIVEDVFAESDFIHQQLNRMGIESKIVFYNNRSLQRKWKVDSKAMSYFDILISQIKDFKPDVIMISDAGYFSFDETVFIKECLGSGKIKLVSFHFTTLNEMFKKNAILYDQIYTGNKTWLYFMRKLGLPAYLLRHAFEPSILDRLSNYERNNKICFLGSIYVENSIHTNRLDMLDKLIKANLPYDFYGNIYGTIQDLISNKECKKYIGIIAEIVSNMRSGVFGLEYYNIMNQYNICLNLHAFGVNDYGAGNMRMFEATGIGTCLLTDNKNENKELFDIDKEIVVYDSFDDMVEKARWLIDNPKKALEIALAGQKRTLNDYTYKNKAEQLNEYIQKLIV